MDKKYIWDMIDYYGIKYAQKENSNVGNEHVYLWHFGFSIPTKKAIEEIVNFVGKDEVLEVGAGLGLWSYIMQIYGLVVHVTELEPYGKYASFTDIEYIDGIKAIKKYKTNVLMLVCPDIDSGLSESALKAFKGDKLIYVGEERTVTTKELDKLSDKTDIDVGEFSNMLKKYYPSTGSAEFHNILEKDWIVYNRIRLPNFIYNKYDLLLYVRK